MPITQRNKDYPEERRLATVLFADVHGFTSLAEQLDYEIVADLLKEIWRRLDTVIEAHGGYIDKHIGDGVMAVWGAPFASEDDAERAVTAALALLEALKEYTQISTIEGARALTMRIGVNTGPVLSGYIGIHDEYTVIGDTVNVANRLEQTAEPGTVVISESTFRMVRGLFRVRRMASFHLKGKTEPVAPFQVDGKAQAAGKVRYQGTGSLETCLVAREAEMAQLDQLYRQALKADTPTLVLLTGEVGMGKSRLMMEFASQLEMEEPDLVLLSARALAQAGRVPFYLWKSLLQSPFDIHEDDPAASAMDKLLAGMKEYWGNKANRLSPVAPSQPVTSTPDEAAQLIGQLTGLVYDGASGGLTNLPATGGAEVFPDVQIRRAYEQIRRLLLKISQASPTILLIDDLQWADSGSLDLLSYLLQPGGPRLPLLVLAGARQELLRSQPRWANMAHVITLKPLPIASQTVAKAYPVLRRLPENVQLELISQADGNPYFLEEMVKDLVKTGVLEVGPYSEELLDRLREQPPESLQAILQARLDSLPKEVRQLALLASVSGRVFWVGAIKAAVRISSSMGTGQLNLMPPAVLDRVLQDSLRQLVRAEMVFPRAGSRYSDEQEFIFKHSLLREVAYSLIPHRYLRQYHLAVAQFLAGRASPEFKVMAAEHFEVGGAVMEAVQHYRMAAEYAQSRGLTTEAKLMLGRSQALKMSS